ncbi:MAG: GNAT family N-acetyltransferase [Acidimicrobiales bacterium]
MPTAPDEPPPDLGDLDRNHPALTDGVVALRPPTPDDVEAVFDACQDPEIQRWTTVPVPYARADAVGYVDLCRWAWEEAVAAPFVVVDATDPHQLLGTIDLRHTGPSVGEVGYWVAPWARRRGVAGRALTLVRDWALHDLGKQVLTLQVYEGNEASVRVAEAAGFHRAGEIVADQRGVDRRAVLYSLVTETETETETERSGGSTGGDR